MKESELLRLKKNIEDAKAKATELQGKYKYLQEQLKETWDCGSLEEAEKKLEEMDEEISAMDQNIEKLVNEIKGKYNV